MFGTFKNDTIINMARAIQFTKYNQQYGQNNQSNIISNTIRTNSGIITVILLVALTQRVETQAKA